MYLLDTDHCSGLIDGRPEILERLTRLGDAEVSTCVIVRGELRFMVERSERRTENDAKVGSFLAEIVVHPVDDETAEIYGALKQRLYARYAPREQRNKPSLERLGFKENDLWIAAIAVRHGLVVVSRDDDFPRMKDAAPELACESWFDLF